MSEEQESNEATKCHEVRLPKSLQGMENADVLWKMITKRFPNAAPLLCEMEAVIDRADDLLRQLRAPCTKSFETSSLNNFVDSEESDNIISLICDESFPEDTDVFEDVAVTTNTAETEVSESSIFAMDSDFDSLEKSNDSRNDIHYEEDQEEKNNSPVIEHSSSKMNETTSLESWGKLVDNETKNVDAPRPTNEQNVRDQVESQAKSNRTVVTKVFERTKKNEKKNSAGDWEDNVRETNSSTRDALQEMETRENSDPLDNKEGHPISGDDNVQREIHCKTPWDILEEYANRCNVKIEYHCEKNKCNRYVITGKLSEFSATVCDEDQELAKSSIAKRILQNLVDHQMNDKEMKQLLELSREQILEILNFGNDETIVTPLRKVYMFCLKKGALPPKYITERGYTYQGVKFVAKCMALDHVTEGHGVSSYNAKKAAAEEFYKKYCSKKT